MCRRTQGLSVVCVRQSHLDSCILLDVDIAAQLLVLSLQLADALLLGGERLADAGTRPAASSSACASHRRTAVSPSFMSRQTSPTLKPCSRIICTTCSLNSALNVRLCFLLMFLVQVDSTYQGVQGNQTSTFRAGLAPSLTQMGVSEQL